MKAFLVSLVAIAIISFGAAVVLGTIDRSAEDVYSTGSVRH